MKKSRIIRKKSKIKLATPKGNKKREPVDFGTEVPFFVIPLVLLALVIFCRQSFASEGFDPSRFDRFILAWLLVAVLPYGFLADKIKVASNRLEVYLVSGLLGMALTTLLYFILGFLKATWLFIPFIAIGVLFSFPLYKKTFLNLAAKVHVSFAALSAVVPLYIYWRWIVVRAMFHWDTVFESHDPFFNLADSAALLRSIPPIDPRNAHFIFHYHYFNDLFVAILSKYSGVDLFDTVRLMPFFQTILLAWVAYKLLRSLFENPWSGTLGLFILLMSCDFGVLFPYVDGWLKHLSQPSNLCPQYEIFYGSFSNAMIHNATERPSFVLALSAVLFWTRKLEDDNNWAWVLGCLLMALCFKFKSTTFYGAALGLMVAALIEAVWQRKFFWLKTGFLTLLMALPFLAEFHGPWSVQTGSVEGVGFQPGQQILNTLNRMSPYPVLYEKCIVDLSTLNRVLLIVICTLGVHVFGIWSCFRSLSAVSVLRPIHLFMAACMLGFAFPFFFYSCWGGQSEYFLLQFSTMCMGLYSAPFWTGLIFDQWTFDHKVLSRAALLGLGIIFYGYCLSYYNNYSRLFSGGLDEDDVKACEFIRSNTPPDSVLLTNLITEIMSPYQAYCQRQALVIDHLGPNPPQDFFNTKDPVEMKSILDSEKVDYVLANPPLAEDLTGKLKLKEVFKQGNNEVYQAIK